MDFFVIVRINWYIVHNVLYRVYELEKTLQRRVIGNILTIYRLKQYSVMILSVHSVIVHIPG